MDKPFQRKGAVSNAQVGRDFETIAQQFFAKQGLHLKLGIAVQIGINGLKSHNFDLGNELGKVLVECKAHTWTEGGNVPSAKLTVWNEAMFFFHAAPSSYRKILFVLRDFSQKRKETLESTTFGQIPISFRRMLKCGNLMKSRAPQLSSDSQRTKASRRTLRSRAADARR